MALLRLLPLCPSRSANDPVVLELQTCSPRCVELTLKNSSAIRDSSSTHIFRRVLKTHCFQQAFGSPGTRRLTHVPQIRPLADTVHSKDRFTYLLA